MLLYVLKRVGLMAASFMALVVITILMLRSAPASTVELSQFQFSWDMIRYVVLTAFPVTLQLVSVSMILSLTFGVLFGAVAALNRNTWVDRFVMLLSTFGRVVPSYVLASLFLVLFAVRLRVLRTQGWGRPQHFVLPVLALAPPPVALFARYMRVSLISVLSEEYVRTGYAKGGTHWRIIWRHGLRNALIPLMTVAGPEFAFLMMGTTWVESWFNIPGLGRVITGSGRSDPSMVVLATALLGLLVMAMNLLVDIGYAVLDPRIRVGYTLGKTKV